MEGICESSNIMKKILKHELYRGIFCYRTLLILAIGLLLVAGQLAAYYQVHLMNLKQDSQWILSDGSYAIGCYPDNMYESFLGGEGYTFFGELFYSFLPIMAVFSYGTSYFKDKRDGYANLLITRIGKNNYFVSKLIASFLLGGTFCVIPYFVSLFASSLLYPANYPNVMSWDSPLIERSLMSGVYYVHPMIYMLAYSVIVFLVGGILALCALIASVYAKNEMVVIFCPYVLYALQEAVFMKMGLSKWALKILVFQAKYSGAIIDVSYIQVLAYLIFILTIEGGIFLWKTMKIEITSLS